jgi:hypothetical protein
MRQYEIGAASAGRVGACARVARGALVRVLLRSVAVAAVAAGVVAVVLPQAVPAVHAAEKAKQPPRVASAVVKKLKPAQEAIQKGDYDTGIQLAKEALEIAQSPYDREVSLRTLMAGLGNKKDFSGYAAALEQLLVANPENLAADELMRFHKQLAQINYQDNNYEKSQKYAELWVQDGGGTEANEVLAATFLVRKDCKNGIGPLEKSLEGKEPTETQLRQLNFCYYSLGDKPKREAAMQTLLFRFPKREYFIDLTNIYQEENADSRAVLAMYRLGLAKDWLTRESEFMEYADMALEAGSPAEAQQVYEAAGAKGLVTKGERSERIRTQSKQLAADDRKMIAGLDKEAKAGRNGEADVKVGLGYLGLGDNQKALDALQRGLSPERIAKVKRVDDANMMLGIVQLRLGNKAEAARAFEEAKKDPRMAKAADLWLKLETT